MNHRNHDEKMPQEMADELSWWSAFVTYAYGTTHQILHLQNDHQNFRLNIAKNQKERKSEIF